MLANRSKNSNNHKLKRLDLIHRFIHKHLIIFINTYNTYIFLVLISDKKKELMAQNNSITYILSIIIAFAKEIHFIRLSLNYVFA